MAQRGPDWAAWVAGLPRLREEILAEWQLTPDGESVNGFCSLVLPVRRPGGGPAMLKLAFPDEESEHEALALQHWRGRGAVGLIRAAPDRRALLLERLHPEDLQSLWDIEATEIVAGLYAQIHVPAPPRLRTLTSYVERWSRELSDLPRSAPLPPRLVAQAAGLGAGFSGDAASTGTLIHTDLHYANVLAADRAEWQVIDPKPLNGDPHYEVAPLLWNRFEELTGRVRDGIRQRFHTAVDVAGLDEARARDWVIVRMLTNALWRLQDPPGTQRLTSTDDFLTMCVTVAKAVQD